MLCPYCLHEAPEGNYKNNTCPENKCKVPPLYVREYRTSPPIIMNAIGFRQHGKTIYFDALFAALTDLSNVWAKFFTTPMSERSLDIIHEHIGLLRDRGELPNATNAVFPEPTLVRARHFPFQPSSTFLFYDTGGECFSRPSTLVKNAHFVTRSKTALFLISLPRFREDNEDEAAEMKKLLDIYINGMAELPGSNTHKQHLVVVFTMADELVPRFRGNWSDIEAHLKYGTLEQLKAHKEYWRSLPRISRRLYEFTRDELKANEFLHEAEDSFASVNFTVVSSLGARPNGQRLSSQMSSKCIMDPLLWVVKHSATGMQAFLNGMG